MTRKPLREGTDEAISGDAATASENEKAPGFTPGPWLISRFRLNFGVVVVPAVHFDRPFGASVDLKHHRATYAAPIAHVCDEQGRHFSREEGNANARLIAAAPELLAALKSLMGDIDSGVLITRDSRPDWALEMLAFVQRLQAAQQAIAKAEGRESR